MSVAPSHTDDSVRPQMERSGRWRRSHSRERVFKVAVRRGLYVRGCVGCVSACVKSVSLCDRVCVCVCVCVCSRDAVK